MLSSWTQSLSKLGELHPSVFMWSEPWRGLKNFHILAFFPVSHLDIADQLFFACAVLSDFESDKRLVD